VGLLWELAGSNSLRWYLARHPLHLLQTGGHITVSAVVKQSWKSKGKVIQGRFDELPLEHQEFIRRVLNNNTEMGHAGCSVFAQALDSGSNPYMHVLLLDGTTIAWGANNNHWPAAMAYTHPNWRKQGIGTLLFQLSKLWWEYQEK